MEALRKQFSSFDYLVPDKSKEESTPSIGSQALDEAVVVYSDPIFKALENAPNREMRAHDLVRQVNQERSIPRFESFMEVIYHLEKLKFLEIVEKDITGNHLIRLLRKP